MSVVYGKTARVESGHRGQTNGRHFEHVLDLHATARAAAIARRITSPSLTVRNITSASADGETTFGATPPLMSPTV